MEITTKWIHLLLIVQLEQLLFPSTACTCLVEVIGVWCCLLEAYGRFTSRWSADLRAKTKPLNKSIVLKEPVAPRWRTRVSRRCCWGKCSFPRCLSVVSVLVWLAASCFSWVLIRSAIVERLVSWFQNLHSKQKRPILPYGQPWLQHRAPILLFMVVNFFNIGSSFLTQFSLHPWAFYSNVGIPSLLLGTMVKIGFLCSLIAI
jgi:hypothetical protein